MTNSLSFLPQVDEIVMIENGEIAQIGTYQQLKNRDGLFSYFTKNCLEKKTSIIGIFLLFFSLLYLQIYKIVFKIHKTLILSKCKNEFGNFRN